LRDVHVEMPVLTEDETARIERACQRLAASFAVFVDNERFDEAAALFAVDGVLRTVRGSVFKGRSEIANALRNGRPPGSKVVHHTSPLFVDIVSPSEVSGSSSYAAFMNKETASSLPVVVAYWEDKYKSTNEGWRIAERRSRLIAGQI
jgi:SnoaL-like domain